MLSPNGREIDIRPTPNGSKGAGVTQCADYRSWRRDLWLQSLRDPGAYKIHDLRDYGLIDNPNEIPPFLAP